MAEIYTFSEHSLTISGEKYDLLALMEYLDGVETGNTWADLLDKMRLEFDEDFRKETEAREP